MKHLKCERDGDESTHHSWHLLILGCLSPTFDMHIDKH